MLPIYVPAIRSLKIPQKYIYIFLWLMSHNKLLTKDNLLKRNIVKPSSCAYYNENVSINHLLFDCVVAKCVWVEISEFFRKI